MVYLSPFRRILVVTKKLPTVLIPTSVSLLASIVSLSTGVTYSLPLIRRLEIIGSFLFCWAVYLTCCVDCRTVVDISSFRLWHPRWHISNGVTLLYSQCYTNGFQSCFLKGSDVYRLVMCLCLACLSPCVALELLQLS